MRRNLLEFLFGPTAAQQSTQTLGEDVVKLFEEAADEETEQMVANKKPLATALKAIGISNEVVEGAQWCEIHCDDENQYREHVRLLTDADNMHKLAELGWVFALCGDQAMSNEAPGFKIGFIELNMVEIEKAAEPAVSRGMLRSIRAAPVRAVLPKAPVIARTALCARPPALIAGANRPRSDRSGPGCPP